MTDLSTDELRALVEAATPGPWKAKGRTVYHASYGEVAFAQPNDYRGTPEPTAALIALAPSLAAEVLALREEKAKWPTMFGSQTAQLLVELQDAAEKIAALREEREQLMVGLALAEERAALSAEPQP